MAEKSVVKKGVQVVMSKENRDWLIELKYRADMGSIDEVITEFRHNANKK